VKRITISAAAIALGIGIAGVSVPAALASPAATAHVTSVSRSSNWVDGGNYPTLYDCNQAGQQALRTGFAQYRCDPVYAPDGSIGYWQLWFEYP
jgi:hypothetical protein